MLLSGKGLLALLWELFPGHPNLLPAFREPGRTGGQEITKPLWGREGANITAPGIATPGPYGAEGFVHQAWAELPCVDGRYPVLGSWVVAGRPCGLGIREDASPITTDASRFVPHLFDAAPGGDMTLTTLATVPAFLAYFVSSLLLLAAFLTLYCIILPGREWAGSAPATPPPRSAWPGATLGFSLPLAAAIAHSEVLADMAVWAAGLLRRAARRASPPCACCVATWPRRSRAATWRRRSCWLPDRWCWAC